VPPRRRQRGRMLIWSSFYGAQMRCSDGVGGSSLASLSFSVRTACLRTLAFPCLPSPRFCDEPIFGTAVPAPAGQYGLKLSTSIIQSLFAYVPFTCRACSTSEWPLARASGLRSLAISDWKRVLLVRRIPAMKTHNDCTVGLCITPFFGWRGGRCTPNHALLHAPNIGTPLSRP